MVNFLDERLPTRFWDKVQPCPMSGCWLWSAAIAETGYGAFSVSNQARLAHRISYAALVGPIPEGLHIDHLCRVRCCVNPAHLEPVENAENTRRGEAGIVNASKTHCPYGHRYEGENLVLESNDYGRGLGRRCKACNRRRGRDWAYEKRQGRPRPFSGELRPLSEDQIAWADSIMAGGATRKETTSIEVVEPARLLKESA